MSRRDGILPVDGILLLNKPTGVTSNFILQKVRRLFKAKKAGHAGTLDPLATGMLPVCFGEATKFSQYLLNANKAYVTKALLGIKTTTGDADGEVIETKKDFDFSKNDIIKVLNKFHGEISQVPPMYSALKQNGIPLYRLARKGLEVERAPRVIMISSIELLSFDGQYIELKVECTKGTYIRSLVEDIGKELGTFAHIVELHRLFTAGFAGKKIFTPEDLSELNDSDRMKCLLPIDYPLMHYPELYLTDETVRLIQNGQACKVGIDNAVTGMVRMYDKNQKFIGLGEYTEDKNLKPFRLLAFTESHL